MKKTHFIGEDKRLYLEEKEKMAKKKELTAEEMLLQEIEEKEQELASLRKEIKNLERYKGYEDIANEVKAMHDAFMNSGFSDEQAFDLLVKFMELTGGWK